MLSLENLIVKNLSGELVLNVSLSLPSGGIFVLAGFGSSGKSILMRTLAEVLPKGFQCTHDDYQVPPFIKYLPQKEHRFVRFPTGLKGDLTSIVTETLAEQQKPRLVMLDEPDESEELENFLNTIKQASQNTLVLMATHNQEMISKYAEQVITLREGEIFNVMAASKFFKSKNRFITELINMGF